MVISYEINIKNMKQEDKELLLRDLCARLLYGVKVDSVFINPDTKEHKSCGIEVFNATSLLMIRDGLGEFKPYLFPLSSMTEKQYNSLYESGILNNCSHSYEYVNPHIHGVSFIFKEFKTYSLELIEWLNKNHFDYRGLISKGLAIDCTGLNIY